MTISNSNPNPTTILVVDDEPDLVELMVYNLQEHGFNVISACDGAQALELAKSRLPDLVVLDVMMPKLTGIEVAKRLRSQTETSSMPIIMLTARSEEADELAGLGAGADDYITKPFSLKVLIARINALTRRSSTAGSSQGSTLELGPVVVDFDEHQASVDGHPIQLTITEFRVLCALLNNAGKVLSRPALISNAIGPGVAVTERTIDVHITALRKKISPYSSMIATVRGVGYRADLPANQEK
ncbi:MAG: response regulator transcription factor [Phycisphaerales bacterium]|nr:response regulator transcription factor [Phycisphaerales bacterium]